MSTSLNFISSIAAFDSVRIKNEHAKRMIQNYKTNHATEPKTYSVKFTSSDIEEFKKLIAEEKADGFNLYFAQYPSDGTLDPHGKNYRNRATIIFIPTKKGVPVFDPYSEYKDGGDSTAYNHSELNP